jgi:thiosulfate dehydrogenase [quinone] large subunit
MITAFIESFKYSGYLFPISFLRIFLGFEFLNSALTRIEEDFLLQPRLAAEISEWLPYGTAPVWYKNIVSDYVIEHWQFFAYTITFSEFVIAFSFILGFFIRPISLIALVLTFNLMLNSQPALAELYKIHSALIFILLWMGAGRCIGLDYYFFKRHRGIWW